MPTSANEHYWLGLFRTQPSHTLHRPVSGPTLTPLEPLRHRFGTISAGSDLLRATDPDSQEPPCGTLYFVMRYPIAQRSTLKNQFPSFFPKPRRIIRFFSSKINFVTFTSYHSYLATPTGIEPVISCVTGKRLKPLDYGANILCERGWI